MRKKSSMLNSITSVISSIIAMIVGFVAQSVFIKILGTEYLGLNGLFTNILTMLSFFELGIGSAIVYHLYKPIIDEDKEKIKALMKFYKLAYRIIALLVFVTGLLIMPFINKIINEVTVNINIYTIYLLFLINTSSSYLLSYKRNLLEANQKSYITNIVHIVYILVLNVLQLTFLILTRNYYLYLIIKITCQLIENFVNSVIATKLYPYLKDKNIEKVSQDTMKDIIKKVKALFYHKVASSIVNGTDNILISSFFSIELVGLYSSYHMVIGSVYNMFRLFITSSVASVGNLIASNEDEEKRFEVFKRIRFLNFLISCFSGICILVIIQSFISVWIGSQYLLSMFVVVTLIFNFFQKMQRCVYQTFKDSAGIWYEDRFVPIFESILNIVLSIIFLKIFGLAGVFMGTILSGLSLWCFSYPKYIYKNLFKRSYFDYTKETLGYILVFVILASGTYYISTLIVFDNIWLKLLSNTLISLILPNIILIIIYRKTDNFIYFKDLVKNVFLKALKK